MNVRPPRLLIVDDDRASQIVYTQLAKRYSFSFEVACDGPQAIEVYRRSPREFTHIIMDWRMPEMSGTQCAHEMRKIQRAEKTFAPILCITAAAMDGDRERVLREGMDDYLSKPFSIGQFIDMLARWSAFEYQSEPAVT